MAKQETASAKQAQLRTADSETKALVSADERPDQQLLPFETAGRRNFKLHWPSVFVFRFPLSRTNRSVFSAHPDTTADHAQQLYKTFQRDLKLFSLAANPLEVRLSENLMNLDFGGLHACVAKFTFVPKWYSHERAVRTYKLPKGVYLDPEEDLPTKLFRTHLRSIRDAAIENRFNSSWRVDDGRVHELHFSLIDEGTVRRLTQPSIPGERRRVREQERHQKLNPFDELAQLATPTEPTAELLKLTAALEHAKTAEPPDKKQFVKFVIAALERHGLAIKVDATRQICRRLCLDRNGYIMLQPTTGGLSAFKGASFTLVPYHRPYCRKKPRTAG